MSMSIFIPGQLPDIHSSKTASGRTRVARQLQLFRTIAVHGDRAPPARVHARMRKPRLRWRRNYGAARVVHDILDQLGEQRLAETKNSFG